MYLLQRFALKIKGGHGVKDNSKPWGGVDLRQWTRFIHWIDDDRPAFPTYNSSVAPNCLKD
jgi:hypothetical protein